MAASIECTDVRIAYGADVVAEALSFRAEEGAFLCLLGPSGCGKSTLLRAIGALQEVDGRVAVDGRAPRDSWSRLAFVFQQPRLLPWRTALDNVATGVQLRDGAWSVRGLRESVRPNLARVGLGTLADRPAHLLSGGESQRVAIARALALAPDVLLMDEPFSALDVRTRLDLRRQLVELWKEARVTVVFVTHDLDEALELATQVIVFSQKPTAVLRDFRIDVPHDQRSASPLIARHREEILEEFGAVRSGAEPSVARQPPPPSTGALTSCRSLT